MPISIGHATNFLNIVSCLIFLFLILYLYLIQTENSSFETWTENVVLASTGTMVKTISETNKTLMNLCTQDDHTNEKLAMPDILFSINGSAYQGSVFVSKNDFPIDSKTIMGLVLIISLGFHSWRVYQSAEGDFENNAKNMVEEPDFLRWIEYTLTSPLQIIIVCSTVYMRNISDITLLSALQGALTLSGWTLEILISGLEQSRIYMTTRRDNHYQNFNENLQKFVLVFSYGVLCHIIIWWNILSRYVMHEQNIEICDFGVKRLPPIIKNIVFLQCVLFSLFGLVPVSQIVYISYRKPAGSTFGLAKLAYGVLSVISKGLLAIMFVKLITDGNCIYTNEGKICLS